MKKTFGKVILVVLCMAVIIFLLLPFLETSAPQANTTAAQKATPQIFTSNPLTELVNRIARFFGKRQAQPQTPQTLTAQQVNENFGTPQTGEAYADARAAAQNYISTEETPSAGTTRNSDFSNAAFQDEEGDWVLIRQKSPDLGTPGMHEINSKDNAYDSYMRQERAARFTPTAVIKQKKEVPDSKLARLFNPIKRFLGFDSAEQRLPNQNIWQEQDAALLASSQGIGKSRNTTGSSFAQGGNVDLPGLGEGFSGAGAESEQGNLLSFLDPEKTLDEVSSFLADSKYPNPKTDKEKQDKENYRQQRREEARNYFAARVEERLNRLAAGQEPADELKNLLEGTCANTSPRAVKLTVCGFPPPQSATQSQINSAKQKNQAIFVQKTNLHMPPAAIMPIIGRASQEPPMTEAKEPQEQYVKSMEIYQFMYKNSECADSPCYWVANSVQVNTDLPDATEAAGATLRGDPLGKYASIQKQFVEFKQEADPTLKPEEITQQTEDFAPAYILYTLDELKAVQSKNMEAMRNRDQKAGTALYALSAPIAKQLNDDLGTPTFFYGRNDAFIDADSYPTFEERSTVLTNDLADQIQFFQQISKEIKRNASREVVEEKTRARAKEIQQRAMQERKEFDKNNGLGQTERGE